MNIKTIKLKSSILAGLCACYLFFGSWFQGDIKDIAKPYMGEYECSRATLNGVDCLERFDYIKLELRGDGKFILYYCEKSNKKNTVKGVYEYDDQSKSIVFKLGDKQGLQRKFPIKDGKLYITASLGGRVLAIEFLQK